MFVKSVLTASLVAVLAVGPAFGCDHSNKSAGLRKNHHPAHNLPVAGVEKASKINLNQSTAEDLMQIPQMTAAKAKAIVAYREKNGLFESLEDLSKVKGFNRMKPEKLKAIQAQLNIS